MTDDEILSQLEFHPYGEERDGQERAHCALTCGCTFVWPQWFAMQVILVALDEQWACPRCGIEGVHVGRCRPLDEAFYAPLEALEFEPVIECCMPSVECYHYGAHQAHWHCVMSCGCSRFVCEPVLANFRRWLSEGEVACRDCGQDTTVADAKPI